MVNIPEEYVALYLRLNGFLLLTGFTLLSASEQAKEIDVIAIRCPNCVEKVGDIWLSVDENPFDGVLDRKKIIPLVCEVKGNYQEPTFDGGKTDYVRNFFGDFGKATVQLAVSQKYDRMGGSPKEAGNMRVNIGLGYLAKRTRQLVEKRAAECKKAGSWSHSRGLLQKLLLFGEDL